jgi:hypothetical protein
MKEDEMKAAILKNAGELKFDDFAIHPIWTWAENDEDESSVMPLDYPGALPEDHDALFVGCEFLLSDGTKIAGAISIRMSNHSVYLISFPKADGRFFDFPLHPQLTTVTREQLAIQLGKRVEHVFPIRYNTSYKFSNGQSVAGQIE